MHPRYCLSEHHHSHKCTCAPSHLRRAPPRMRYESRQQPPICLLFNSRSGHQCRYKQCRYAHIWSGCRANHPAADCHRGQPPSPRLPSARANHPAADCHRGQPPSPRLPSARANHPAADCHRGQPPSPRLPSASYHKI